MAQVVVFPSVLGVRPGVTGLAERLRGLGHTVTVYDQVGEVFDEYEPAVAANEARGIAAQLEFARDATAELASGAYVIGFSAGAALAEFVALTRAGIAGCVVFGGGLPVHWLEQPGWPAGVALQSHQSIDDPWRDAGANEELLADALAAGAPAAHYDYPGSGHLFFDPSLPEEFDPDAAALFERRLTAFLGGGAP